MEIKNKEGEGRIWREGETRGRKEQREIRKRGECREGETSFFSLHSLILLTECDRVHEAVETE